MQNINQIRTLKLLTPCLRKKIEEASGTKICPCKIQDPCEPDMFAVDPNCPQPKVLIVGAGIAGLSAAQRLFKGGLRYVTVLEALDRPGGRIHTVSVGSDVAELGAGMIFGASMSNPVFCLACQAGIVDEPLIRISEHRGFYFLSSGRSIPTRICMAAAYVFDDIVQKARQSIGKGATNVSLWNFFDKEFIKQIQLFPICDQYPAKNVLYGLTNSVRTLLGTDLVNVPANRFGYWRTMPGGNVAPRGGMKGVLEPLLKDIPKESIKYSKPVKTIRWRPPNPNTARVVVETCSGEQFEGDYVIVTLPLGVLQEQYADIFHPKLPPEKVAAIQKVKFGPVNNICLHYERPFWVHTEGCMRSCWSKDELLDLRTWTKSIGKVEDFTNSKNILTTTIAGSSAICIEKLTECEVGIEMTKILRCFLGDPTVPQPKTVLRSKWSSNPFFRGGITYLDENCSETDQERLAEPIPDKSEEKAPMLFFAGEACYPGFQGTTHGARLSGLQEAERVLNLTKCYCGPPPTQKFCPAAY